MLLYRIFLALPPEKVRDLSPSLVFHGLPALVPLLLSNLHPVWVPIMPPFLLDSVPLILAPHLSYQLVPALLHPDVPLQVSNLLAVLLPTYPMC